MNGVLSINKPKGPTSHDVVARLRRLTGVRRIGHTGTLDPMAVGVLVCCIGQATRVAPWLVGLPKEYTGEMTLGARSNTYDVEGEIEQVADASSVKEKDIRAAFQSLTGIIDQTAPPFSAVKFRGKKLYEYAREGETVPEISRSVRIERFDLVRYLPPTAMFHVRVGSGTYVRSLAHAVGEKLGCGAYLSALCRVSVGAFHVEDAFPLEEVEQMPLEAFETALLPIEQALIHLPKLTLMPAAESRLRHGGPFRIVDVKTSESIPPTGEPILVLSGAGEAIAVVESEAPEGPFTPLRVLSVEE